MSVLVTDCFTSNSTLVKGCEASEVRHLRRVELTPLCLGSPGFSTALTRGTLSGHVWIYTGRGGVTCQPPDAAALKAGGALLGTGGAFVPSGWTSIDQHVSARAALDSDHPGRHLWFSSSGQPGPCQAPLANY